MKNLKPLFIALLSMTATVTHAITVGTFDVAVGGNIYTSTTVGQMLFGTQTGTGIATLDSNGTVTIESNFHIIYSSDYNTFDDLYNTTSVFTGVYAENYWGPGLSYFFIANNFVGQQERINSCTGESCAVVTIGSFYNYAYTQGDFGTSAYGGVIDTTQAIKDSYGSLAFTISRNFSLSNFQSAPTVPLPQTIWLFGSGLLGVAGAARKRRSKPA